MNKSSDGAETSEESGTATENVFTMMMNVQKNQTFLPARKTEVDKLGKTLRKNKMFNEILDILNSSKLGWPKDDVGEDGRGYLMVKTIPPPRGGGGGCL